ncbi:DUF4365 domain-containing protein [Sorangium sp. So ce124]|uniref:DUF4365 domain-containing protein n=1 Tax=Sorangium sp. So ce124 TaxID=3133280 RepID=UPI003F634F0C
MKLSANKITGRLGVNYVERVALEAGCKPIFMPEDLDTGIDGFIEFVGDAATLVAFQVKRGPSFFDNAGAKHQADARHLRYWKGYVLPVILIIVRDDESDALWMDVRQHVRDSPSIVERGPFVLRPPRLQRFESAALTGVIRKLATPYQFGDAVSALCDADGETRLSALSLLYRFRMERRTPFCLAAALRAELDLDALATFCDFYSRYMSHPEVPFGADRELSAYARSLLAGLPRSQLLNLLAAFNSDEEYGDWDGATEIYSMSEEEIWDRHAVVERGTVQQGIAVVVGAAASPEQLLSVLADSEVTLGQRKAAVALFGYLGYTCDVDSVDSILGRETDAPLCALLTWLRYWLVLETRTDGDGTVTA